MNKKYLIGLVPHELIQYIKHVDEENDKITFYDDNLSREAIDKIRDLHKKINIEEYNQFIRKRQLINSHDYIKEGEKLQTEVIPRHPLQSGLGMWGSPTPPTSHP